MRNLIILAISIHFWRTTEFEALVNRYEAVIHPGFITIITCINPPGVTYVEQMVQYRNQGINGAVKGSGGAVGLTANPAALRRWTVAGPEVARLVAEFEEDQVDGGPGAKRNIEGLHHEQQPGVQSAFLKDVQSLTLVLQYMGNQFLEGSNDLLVLDTQDIMESVAGTLRKVETIGQKQYSKFVDERLSKCVTPVSVHCPITNYHSSAAQQ